MAAAEEESMMAPEEVVVWEHRCPFLDCVCCWFYPGIPRIAPGLDSVCIPADADHRPAWSLLVGVTNGASLRVSRIRVARSGRIHGRSDDKLEAFRDIVLAKPPGYAFDAGAALDPDGRSLCVLRTDDNQQPQALQLSLQTGTQDSRLPEIQGTTSPCMPISYAGQIWALSATLMQDDDIDWSKCFFDCSKQVDPSDGMEWTDGIVRPDYFGNFSVVARRLLLEPARWEQVGQPFTCPLIHLGCPPWNGGLLQGCAVLPGDKLILVSFQQYGLFLTFAPDSGCWTPVRTDPKRSSEYVPIRGRGIYMEQHHAVYLLCDNTIYAYKLTYQQDDQGTRQLSLDPPIKIHSVCPFMPHKGYGFLTRLAGRLFCSVWISLASRRACPCDHLHAIVTTFHLRDVALGGGIEVLHSTYRRLDMVPDPPNQAFYFLQEFEDESFPALPQHEEQEDVSQHVNKPSKKLVCCRALDRSLSLTTWCFQCGGDGHVVPQCTEKRKKTISTIPPFGPSRTIPVDPSSRQRQVPSSSPVLTVNPAIKKDVLIICQVGSQSVIFQTGAMHDDGKPLQPCYVADDGDHYWHFFQSGSKINAVSCTKDGMLEFSLNKDRKTLNLPVRRPTADPFIMVIKVGGVTIALTDTLQVFHQEKFHFGPSTWLRYVTRGLDGRKVKVLLSGYVAVNDNSFIICDAVTCSCLLFDLGAKQWRDIMPLAAFEEDLPGTIHTNVLLNGRCVFVDGFIYTCINGGIAAYELVGECRSLFISKSIFLPFSWPAGCVGGDMCLDYAGKDEESGTIWFYVVRGGHSLPKHDVQITTVKVKTKRTAGDKMIPAGIDCVGSVTRFIHHEEPVYTRCCFAVSCA